ncbi:cytochrome-c peroxidase [Aestuariirhabdus sp. Z084]|uniref:cytochrome-c peroxidase n=1 Tax=Aestuariirhabdus haliotis TaxID=2918751 RepID=UPI00201B3A98|nr:cytochrome c peroxidase [Aestuariirhabdus haliotis]MCL6416554.1 cytochrome-c peroxidase [Aestuariirhabdus haliotis]MCL6420579.1 cytochrome-c peroxidase [Aestuariirhabdus haliotis]
MNIIKKASLKRLATTLAGSSLLIAISASAAMAPAPLAPLGEPPIPPDNKQTEAKIELGKILFFDGRLGGDGSTACSACHLPSAGWDWPADISLGYPGTVHWRNSQTIINSAYYGKLFWAGSANSLEKQAKSAAKGAVAGNGENDIMEARLALIPEYRERFQDVFGDQWPKVGNAWMAIAAFERTLVQTDTPVDNYLRGDKKALSKQQLNGKTLFEGKAGCIQCHSGALATNEAYYNIGVPANKTWETDALRQITFRYELYAKGSYEESYRKLKGDPGLYFRGKIKSQQGKFRVPSLRYTKYTAPYMHNGTVATLKDVVEFYNRGGKMADGSTTEFPETKSQLIQPLNLSESEVDDLVAFIEGFSGDRITMDTPKMPPYAPLFTKEQLMEATK